MRDFYSREIGIVLIPTWSFPLQNGPVGTQEFSRKWKCGVVKILKLCNVLIEALNIFSFLYCLCCSPKLCAVWLSFLQTRKFLLVEIYFLIFWDSWIWDSEDTVGIKIIIIILIDSLSPTFSYSFCILLMNVEGGKSSRESWRWKRVKKEKERWKIRY